MLNLTTRISRSRLLVTLAAALCLTACDPSGEQRADGGAPQENAAEQMNPEQMNPEQMNADNERVDPRDELAPELVDELAVEEELVEEELVEEELVEEEVAPEVDIIAEEEAADALAEEEQLDPEVYAEICEAHDYRTNQDPACARAFYEEVVHDSRIETTNAKEARIEACLAKGGEPHYNAEAPAKLGCLNGRNVLKQSYGKGKQLPFPDYDPTVGDDDDTPLECAFKDAQYIRAAALELSAGKPKLKGGFRWVYYNGSQQVCIER